MTTIELRTSIAAELDQMSVEMLESVSRYVKRLRHHPCPRMFLQRVKQEEPSPNVLSNRKEPSPSV